MSFLKNILLLAGIVGVTFLPIWIGHGLSEGSGPKMLLGVGLGALGFGILFLLKKIAGPGRVDGQPTSN